MEKAHVLDVFVKNGYNRHVGQKAFLKAKKEPSIRRDPNDRVMGVNLPYIQGATNRTARILRKFDVPATFRPLNTIHSSLTSVKDPIDPKEMKGVYVIPCSCGIPYIGETGRSINQWISEHSSDLRHGRTKSSALAEHAEKTMHHVCIEEAQVIAKVAQFHHRKFREALEIEKGRKILIGMMAGRSAVAGSQPCLPSLRGPFLVRS